MNHRNKVTTAKPYFPEDDIQEIVSRVPGILKGQLSMGSFVTELEAQTIRMANSAYGVAVNSCTSALEIALQAIDLHEQDEVILPAQTFFATAAAVYHAGGVPVFCDIDRSSHCIDVDDALRKIGERTRAIIIVHFGGLISPDINRLVDACNQRDILLIEDAAHAHGAQKQGHPAGSFGTMACFSFGATKVLTAGGEGGVITTKSSEIYARCRSYQSRGQQLEREDEEVFERFGRNVRMTEFSALCGVVQYRRLQEIIDRRNDIAKLYNEFIESELPECEIQCHPKDTVHPYWKHVLVLPTGMSRVRLKEKMADDFNIPINWSYYPAVHQMPVFQNDPRYADISLPVAEHICEYSINLPMHAHLSVGDAEEILSALRNSFNNI